MAIYPRESFGDKLYPLDDHNKNYFTIWSEENAKRAFYEIYAYIVKSDTPDKESLKKW